MRDLNYYEKDLKSHRNNPKVCILSGGDDWLYINELINKFYANITVIGPNPKLMIELDKVKDYDIVILDTDKPFMESMFYGIADLAAVINIHFNNSVSLVYSFKKDNKKVAIKQYSDRNGLQDLGFVEGMCDVRNMLNSSYGILLDKRKKNKKKQKKKSK